MKRIRHATMIAPTEAAWRVGNWLSRLCLVRPVAAETDIGIDLYCELVQQEESFLHFWVQVKTGKGRSRIVFDKDTERARYRFRAKDLEYWWRQPVPVFAFLVPPRGHPSDPWLYVVDVTRWLISRAGPLGRDEWIDAQHRCELQGDSDLKQLLWDTVPKTYAMGAIRDGVSNVVPQLKPGYEVVAMYGYRAPFAKKVADQVRHSASDTLTDLMRSPLAVPGKAGFAAFLARVVKVHQEYAAAERKAGVPSDQRLFTQHWEDYRAIGLFALGQGRVSKARSHFRKARRTILGDSKIDSADLRWQPSIMDLDKLIAFCDGLLAKRKEAQSCPPEQR